MTYPIRGERQAHALQLTPRLAEAEVVLFRLRDYEVELDLFPEQQVGEREGMQCRLIHLSYEQTDELHEHLKRQLGAVFVGCVVGYDLLTWYLELKPRY